MIGFVYIWHNKVNGKMYIGSHQGNVDDGYLGSGVAFKRAIEKYGIENFERNILYEEYKSIESLLLKENEIINQYNAVMSRKFYNMTNYDPKLPIGTNRTRRHSEETKRKMSEAAKSRGPVSEATKTKMSATRKGRPSPTKGKRGLTAGKKNGMYGKKWYTDGTKSFPYVPGTEPRGWYKGKISNTVGDRNGFYGKRHTEESKQKMRESLLRRRNETS